MDQARTRLSRRSYLWVAAIGLALAGVGVWYGAEGRRPRLKNVLLISIDTLRADHLGYMGYDLPTSPALDRFAAQCLQFRNAFSQASLTLPSHSSMFTSVYPSVHRALMAKRIPLADGFTTLAERFHEAGFQTAAFVEGGQMSAIWNLDQGFDVYDDITRHPGFGLHDVECLPETLSTAGDWIDRHHHQPFFCFVHSYVVHGPYTPPPPYDRMFDPDYDGPVSSPFYPDATELFKDRRPSRDDPDVRHVIALYDGEIRYMDDQLAGFLERIKAMGLDQNTVLAFTSDHGEEFAEHGSVGRHGDTVYDEVVHVPLLLRIPGVSPQVITRQVRLLDLAPTLLNLMGLEAAREFPQGQNLRAGDSWTGFDLPAISQAPTPVGSLVALRRPSRKIIGVQGIDFALYELDEDPAERRDAFDWNNPAHAELVAEIQALMAGANDMSRELPDPVELEPEVEEQLRLLGYLE